MGIEASVQITALVDHPSDDEVAEIAALRRAVEAEVEPDDPPVSLAEVAGELRVPWPRHRRLSWTARVDGVLIGWMSAYVDLRESNRGLVDVDDAIQVLPEFRRRGVATELLRAALPALADVGGTTLMAAPHDDAGCAFNRRLGLTQRQLERQSRLRVADVDEAQQDEWIAADAARMAGYGVITFAGAAPGECIEAWAVAVDAMADAPLGELDYTHQTRTPEWVREVEAVQAARGLIRFGALALDSTGAAAGMSLIVLHPARPQLAHQEDTAVVPAHRGHGLGRWLKAANLRAVRAAQPEVAIVETYNAESNGPMLDINVAMGFRPNRTYYAHQAPIGTVRERLGV